ncbi:AI-2E family transporter [Candidatus Hydrogenosomobacter endosymbioticus]|uniref:AI-2E family transporter n=1 Tax=Candidatus Hydrogenosomobacter endosymbioticus TaxID=2558174 RepID=A0ABM7V8F7_9PROT|nr:AI-2E family transporter [Candidatus Hydrogenosomobacter endosymbioticus]BDB96060.1 AI-2E family transporter [Candidatus Hydrogenosomobacter endosymbioticus]
MEIHNKITNRQKVFFIAMVLLMAILFFIVAYRVVMPFIFGVFIAYVFHPIVGFLHSKRIPRSLSAFAVTLSIYLLFMLAVFELFPSMRGLSVFLIDNFSINTDAVFDMIKPMLQRIDIGNEQMEKFGVELGKLLTWIASFLTSAAVHIVENGLSFAYSAFSVALAPIIAFHVMKDWDDLCFRVKTLMPKWMERNAIKLVEEIDVALSGYVRGQLLVCAILATYYSTALYVCSLKFGLSIGAFTGALMFIPYVSFTVSMLVSLMVAFFQSGNIHMVYDIALVYIFGSVLESIVLTPYLVGGKTGLHPVVVLLAVMIGGSLRGVTGVFLALPVATIVAAVWRFLRSNYIKSDLYVCKK